MRAFVLVCWRWFVLCWPPSFLSRLSKLVSLEYMQLTKGGGGYLSSSLIAPLDWQGFSSRKCCRRETRRLLIVLSHWRKSSIDFTGPSPRRMECFLCKDSLRSGLLALGKVGEGWGLNVDKGTFRE